MQCFFTNPSDMKKTISFLMAVLLTVLLASCQKEFEKTIAFGNTKGMKVESYDTHIYLGKTLALDVDADGTDDLKFVSYYDGPLGGTEYQMLHLDCLSGNVSLLGEMTNVEWYTHYDTAFLVASNGHITVLYSTLSNFCEKFSENDVVHTSNKFVLSASNPNDVFSIDDYFQSNTHYLFIENINVGPVDNILESNDTTYVWDSRVIRDCDNFPTNTEKYIGFKITKDGTSRLGWLKLNLIGDETVKVHLIETAIQK